MLICVDVGATKTLLALADLQDEGFKFLETKRIPTPEDRAELMAQIGQFSNDNNADTVSVAIPGRVNQKNQTATLANRNWHEFKIVDELQELVGNHTKIHFENDANLAALGEAIEGAGIGADSVYYVTISTGIGGGFVADKRLSTDVLNTEPGHMVFKHEDTYKIWESFASGSAFVERYGDLAENITDQTVWSEFAHDLAPGFAEISTMFNPECIVVGGSVGAQFEKFKPHLLDQIENIKSSYIPTPEIVKAKYPNQAVIRGCYYYAATYY